MYVGYAQIKTQGFSLKKLSLTLHLSPDKISTITGSSLNYLILNDKVVFGKDTLPESTSINASFRYLQKLFDVIKWILFFKETKIIINMVIISEGMNLQFSSTGCLLKLLKIT